MTLISMRLPKLMVCVCKWYLKLTHVCMVLFTCTCLLFCLILAGMKHFTDYRCFHFCRREVTLNGVARAVGICECKPDALSPVWGDTRCRPGIQVCLASLSFHSFKTKIACHQQFMYCNFFLQVLLCQSCGTPINYLTMRIGGRKSSTRLDLMLFPLQQLISFKKWRTNCALSAGLDK